MARRSSNLLILGAVAAGAFWLLRRQSAPVNGLGWGFSSITSAVKKVAKPVVKVAKVAVAPMVIPSQLVAKAVSKSPLHKALAKSPVGKVLAKSPGNKLLAKVNLTPFPGKRTQAPVAKAGQTIEYQDANGHVITRAEYMRMQEEYDRQATQAAKNKGRPVRTRHQLAPKGSTQGPAIAPGPSGAGQSFVDSNVGLPSSGGGSSGGGGGGGPSESDYYAQQSAAQGAANSGADADVMPTAADDAQPAADAPKKINPLVTIGAFAAVPVILGLVGGHK